MYVCVVFFLICYKNMIIIKWYENNGDYNKIIIMIIKDDVLYESGLLCDYFVFVWVIVCGIYIIVYRGYLN